MVGGASSLMFQVIFFGSLMSFVGNKKYQILAHDPNNGLDELITLFDNGEVVPVIDKCYPFQNVPEAMQYFGERKSKGKIVITME